ncbi:MAG: formyltetrahydrofolate deformylase [Actinomycetes bacterium]
MARHTEEFVLTLTCLERPAIVHAVSRFLVDHDCDIVDNRQFGDPETRRFVMRLHARRPGAPLDLEQLRTDFAPVAEEFGMQWQIHDVADRPRLLVMVSRFDHCLADLLYRWRTGALQADIVAIVSNHEDLRGLAEWYGVPFHHVPVTAETKPAAEQELLELVASYEVDLVVLARYMQVLSDQLCAQLYGRAINIHHSFLPSFKGAKPYHQAHRRGVKLIGATAHYVTPDLDEGPIIEQAVARVDHTATARDLVRIGRDVESLALAHAVQWHVEHRVFLNGDRTVVFR